MINGDVMANGGAGTSTGSGGGSGGSILIEAGIIDGTGSIQVFLLIPNSSLTLFLDSCR